MPVNGLYFFQFTEFALIFGNVVNVEHIHSSKDLHPSCNCERISVYV